MIANVYLFLFPLGILIYFSYFCFRKSKNSAMSKEWIWRRLNSLGYGVQSPNDFFFVQHVLHEKFPYYGYACLEQISQKSDACLPCYSDAINKLLFRVANHVHPDVIVEVGAGTSIFAMATACLSAQCVAITSLNPCDVRLKSLLVEYPHVKLRNSDEKVVLQQILSGSGSVGILHVAHTAHYQEVVSAALPYVNDRTLFIIEGIRDSKEKCDWWKSLQQGDLTGVSYDLGSVGFLFFDSTRHKETYWINFRD